MKKRLLFLLSMGLVLCTAIGLLCVQQDPVEAKGKLLTSHPLTEINQKAKSVRTGNTDDAAAYVAEILKVSSFETDLPGFTAAAGLTIKDRVAAAEINYRQGKSSGIPELQVARTMNDLVNQLHLPNYAKTSRSEIRRLRFMMMPNFPEVIGRNAQSVSPVSAGSRFESEMAPAEAVFILLMMMQQKIYNPEYQLTHSERREHWSEIYDHRPGRDRKANLPSNRTTEMQGALRSVGRSLAPTDVVGVSDTVLSNLGIDGGDRR